VGQDRTVGGSSGTYVVGNSSACKPLSDRPAVWKTSTINRRRPREEDRKRKGRRVLRWNGGKKTHTKNSSFSSAKSKHFQPGGGILGRSARIFEKGASFYNPKTAVDGTIKLSKHGQLKAA
jgi:hypothetical protein